MSLVYEPRPDHSPVSKVCQALHSSNVAHSCRSHVWQTVVAWARPRRQPSPARGLLQRTPERHRSSTGRHSSGLAEIPRQPASFGKRSQRLKISTITSAKTRRLRAIKLAMSMADTQPAGPAPWSGTPEPPLAGPSGNNITGAPFQSPSPAWKTGCQDCWPPAPSRRIG